MADFRANRWIKKKILPEWMKAIKEQGKRFEIRKDEDNIQRGDILWLREWDGEQYTGEEVYVMVKYVLRNASEYGLMDGYCIIGW